MLCVTLRIDDLNNIVQVFMDLIYVHCSIVKLKVVFCLAKSPRKRMGVTIYDSTLVVSRVTYVLPGDVLFSKGFQVIATKVVWLAMSLDHQCAIYHGWAVIFDMYVLNMSLTFIEYVQYI